MYLTAYSVTGGRFPRARLQLTCIGKRPDTSGFSARAVPAGVCRPPLHMLLESFSFHQEYFSMNPNLIRKVQEYLSLILITWFILRQATIIAN